MFANVSTVTDKANTYWESRSDIMAIRRFKPTLRIWRSSHCNAVNYTFGPWRPKSSFEWHIKYWETTRMCLQKSALTSSANRLFSSRINYWVAPTTPVWTPQTIFSIPPLSKLVRRYFFRENVSNRPELDKQTSLVWEHIILKFYLASLSPFLSLIVSTFPTQSLIKYHRNTTVTKAQVHLIWALSPP